MIVTVSVIGSIVTGLVVIYAVLAMLLPQLALSVARIARSLPEMIESISHMVDHLFEGNEVIQNYIMQLSDAGTESLSGWLKESILPYMNMILTGLSDSMINVAGIFHGSVHWSGGGYLSFVWTQKIQKGRANCCCTVCLRSVGRIRLSKRYVFADRVFYGIYWWLKLLDSAIIGGICYIGMMIMGLPYAILISVIVGVTNIIPFFGPYIGAIPSAIILLTVSPMSCLMFVIFIVILQQVDGNIIGPKILGSSTGLSGIWVLFSILLFGGLFGFVGMLIGVPVFAVIYDLIRQLIIRGLELRSKSKMFDDYQQEYPRKE